MKTGNKNINGEEEDKISVIFLLQTAGSFVRKTLFGWNPLEMVMLPLG